MAPTTRTARFLMAGVAAAVALALTAIIWLRQPPFDTRFNGAYRRADGCLIVITPREGRVLRYRMMDGESSALWPVDEASFEAGPGWAERRPVLLRLTFRFGSAGRPEAFTWRQSERELPAERLPLPETLFDFHSDGLRLRGKLVTPVGTGPFPAVVIVHGSGEESAVDSYSDPYLFAANGIATVVYDKRGTGESEGKYTQNFEVLANDVLAAVGWLRSRPEIDPERIHLAGYSQGGWIAPLAARRDGKIRSLLIGYGPAVPVVAEDRWGYVYALREKGYGDEVIARADAISDLIGAILDRGENRWSELGRALDAVKEEPWLPVVRGSDSALGFVTASRMPLWGVRLYAWWRLGKTNGRPFIDRLYDPAPTIEALHSTPSLWIFGGEDQSMPTEWSIAVLERLRAGGRPIQIRVYPRADHGILRFQIGIGGERRYLGHETGYFASEVDWLRLQSGLPSVGSVEPENR